GPPPGRSAASTPPPPPRGPRPRPKPNPPPPPASPSCDLPADLARAAGDGVAQPLDEQHSLQRALNQHIASVAVVAPPSQKPLLAHGIEGPGDHRLGDLEPLGQPAHRVRGGLEINREQDGQLPRRQIRLVI